MTSPHTTCPGCGTLVAPLVSIHHVRDEHDNPHTITFYNCLGCGFSTWDAGDFEWKPSPDYSEEEAEEIMHGYLVGHYHPDHIRRYGGPS